MISQRILERALAGCVIAFLLGLIAHGHFAGSGDPVHYMMIADSLAFDRDLDLANNYADPTNLIAAGELRPGAHAVPGRDGGLYPVHDLGMPLAAAPYFAAAYLIADRLTDRLPEEVRQRAKLTRWLMLRQLMSIGTIAVTALLAICLFRLCLFLSGRPRASFLWTLLWSLSPPILSHAYVFFTEIPSALVALEVYRCLKTRPHLTLWRCSWMGGLTGYLLLVHVRNIGLVLALAMVVLWRLPTLPGPPAVPGRSLSLVAVCTRHTRHAAFLAALAVVALVRSALNLRMWGTWLTSPHVTWGQWASWEGLAAGVGSRLLGLCFDQSHGLLPYAPLYFLAPAGLVVLWRRSKETFREVLAIMLVYLATIVLPMTNIHGWRGGWSPAARFLVPVTPFVAVALFSLLVEWGDRLLVRLLAGPIVLVQCIVDGFFWGHPMLLWNGEDGMSQFLLHLGGVSLARWFPRVDPTSVYTLVSCGWLIVATAALTLALIRARPTPGPSP